MRLESIYADPSTANYVSFLSQAQRGKSRASDRDSIHSVASVRSVISGMSSLLSSLGLGSSNSAARTERNKAAAQADLKYLYSAFTKIPCLRLAPDRKARLIKGYEEFPFDTAVPLWAFKNVSALEISDVDIRQFFGWDRMAEQLRSLTVKRAGVEDPADLLTNIVLDDMDRRRRRSSKNPASPVMGWSYASPHPDLSRSFSAPGSPKSEARVLPGASPQSVPMVRGLSDGPKAPRPRPRSRSPSQPSLARANSSHGHARTGGQRIKRSGSSSSTSSTHSTVFYHSGSSSNLLSMAQLPSTKWRFLKHLSLADNSLTGISASSLAPLANTLHSLDLSSNLFTQVPDSLATLTSLRALNLSHCMIDSLHSLSRNPIPAITALNLRSNRLGSIAGIERLPSLERLDLRTNILADPTELARLTGIPNFHELWVADNPFTKTHGGYRVTIFNLFRNTPGYLDDIVIDGTGPGYSERRHLEDRVAEPTGAPVVRSWPVDSQVALAGVSDLAAPVSPDEKRSSESRPPCSPISTSVKDESSGSIYQLRTRSHRRRKGPRRRIVELSRSDIPSPSREPSSGSGTHEELHTLPSPAQTAVHVDDLAPASVPEPGPAEHLLPRIDTTIPAPSIQAQLVSPLVRDISAPPQDWDVSSDVYRKKIEALRSEVGNGWLSVLSEGGWDGQGPSNVSSRSGEFSPASTIRPSPTTPRAGSQTLVSGARTLG